MALARASSKRARIVRGGVGHFGRRDGRVLFLVEFQLANGNAVQNAFTGTHLHRSFLLPPQSREGFSSRHYTRSDVLAQEFLDCFGAGGFVVALHLDGDRVALLDAHAHQGHQLAQVAGLAALFKGGGACVALDQLHEQAGGACVDAACILNGILEFFS